MRQREERSQIVSLSFPLSPPLKTKQNKKRPEKSKYYLFTLGGEVYKGRGGNEDEVTTGKSLFHLFEKTHIQIKAISFQRHKNSVPV